MGGRVTETHSIHKRNNLIDEGSKFLIIQIWDRQKKEPQKGGQPRPDIELLRNKDY